MIFWICLNAVECWLRFRALALALRQSKDSRANARNVSQHTLYGIQAYAHQPYVDTLYVLPLRQCRPKLILTGISIPMIFLVSSNIAIILIDRFGFQSKDMFPFLMGN